MSDFASVAQSLGGEYLLKHYAYHVLGFTKNLFSVQKQNKNVVSFHKFYVATVKRK